ncbi:GMC family oxidoreductase [Vibrio sp. B172a]|uniref:GMC oxidoreductase n=1 Tax=Vibrio sp. B172a TaxID=2835790 RepID=UPI002552B03F|nr:GMC oxidoreductase [Vibrio sp. B172a]MDK9782800.1 GMC family oxidoreductase [Vibrio sp. B172a]
MDGTNRRVFLKSCVATSVAAGMSVTSPKAQAFFFRPENEQPIDKFKGLPVLESYLPELFDRPPQINGHLPVVVIGSGFGGAISAYRLGLAGIKTAVIERGNRWPNDPKRAVFAHDMLADKRMFWQRTKTTFPALTFDLPFLQTITPRSIEKFGGVLDIVDKPGENNQDGSDLLLGTAVGGGSVIYTGVMVVPKEEHFKKLYPNELSYKEMVDVYYPRVKSILNYSNMPKDVFASAPFKHCRDWNREVSKAGYSPYLIEGNWNWDVIRQELKGKSLPSATIGLTNFGNSNGCKNDLGQNYIPLAEATGNVTFHHKHELINIRMNGDIYELDIQELDAHGNVVQQKTITCEKLILSAGSYHTTRMLVRAKERGDLPELNEYVGKNWGDNGNRMAFRQSLFGLPAGIAQASPSPTAIYVDEAGRSPVAAENWANAGIADVGISMMLSVTADFKNRGHFYYDASIDDAVLHYPKENEKDATDALRAVNNKVARANWQRIGAQGFSDVIFTGAHPVGGMEMGKATDLFGRVDGYSGLYVIDGALIPGNNGCANPALTIAALAERNIENIISKDFS